MTIPTISDVVVLMASGYVLRVPLGAGVPVAGDLVPWRVHTGPPACVSVDIARERHTVPADIVERLIDGRHICKLLENRGDSPGGAFPGWRDLGFDGDKADFYRLVQ